MAKNTMNTNSKNSTNSTSNTSNRTARAIQQVMQITKIKRLRTAAKKTAITQIILTATKMHQTETAQNQCLIMSRFIAE